jgi:hypothetical protein
MVARGLKGNGCLAELRVAGELGRTVLQIGMEATYPSPGGKLLEAL